MFGDSVVANVFRRVLTSFRIGAASSSAGNPFPMANMNVYDGNDLHDNVSTSVNFNGGQGSITNNILLRNLGSEAHMSLGVTNGNVMVK